MSFCNIHYHDLKEREIKIKLVWNFWTTRYTHKYVYRFYYSSLVLGYSTLMVDKLLCANHWATGRLAVSYHDFYLISNDCRQSQNQPPKILLSFANKLLWLLVIACNCVIMFADDQRKEPCFQSTAINGDLWIIWKSMFCNCAICTP